MADDQDHCFQLSVLGNVYLSYCLVLRLPDGQKHGVSSLISLNVKAKTRKGRFHSLGALHACGCGLNKKYIIVDMCKERSWIPQH